MPTLSKGKQAKQHGMVRAECCAHRLLPSWEQQPSTGDIHVPGAQRSRQLTLIPKLLVVFFVRRQHAVVTRLQHGTFLVYGEQPTSSIFRLMCVWFCFPLQLCCVDQICNGSVGTAAHWGDCCFAHWESRNNPNCVNNTRLFRASNLAPSGIRHSHTASPPATRSPGQRPACRAEARPVPPAALPPTPQCSTRAALRAAGRTASGRLPGPGPSRGPRLASAGAVPPRGRPGGERGPGRAAPQRGGLRERQPAAGGPSPLPGAGPRRRLPAARRCGRARPAERRWSSLMASMACEVMPLQRYVSGRRRGEPAVPNEGLS